MSVYSIQNSVTLSTPASGDAGGLKQSHTGGPIDDDLKHGRATLHLGFLIGGDKSCGRGRTHIRQVKILGHATKIPRMGIPQTLTRSTEIEEMKDGAAVIVDHNDIDRDTGSGQERQRIQVVQQRLIADEHRAGCTQPLAKTNPG